MERVTEEDGDYGQKEVEQVRLLTPGAFEVHRKGRQGKYVKLMKVQHLWITFHFQLHIQTSCFLGITPADARYCRIKFIALSKSSDLIIN